MKTAVIMHESDNVANVLEDVEEHDAVRYDACGEDFEITATGSTPFGFKLALKSIAKGADIIKYNEIIGIASTDIKAGECVHIHNVEGKRGRGDLKEGV